MSNIFKNSIAQSNVNFPIETVIEPMAGENYSRAVIFMNLAQAETYLPGVNSPSAGDLYELTSDNYGSLTGDLLKTWLVPFFTKAGTASIGIAIYDEEQVIPPEEEGGEPTIVPATAPIATVYEKVKMYGYFKFGIEEAGKYESLQVSLSNLCAADPLYSALWVGTNDSATLTHSSTLMSALVAANSKARVIYNPNGAINGALAQLGVSLSAANATGTPVGNSVDMVAFNTIGASGNVDEDGNYQNLTPTEKAALDDQKIGYQTTVGDGTANVVTEGSLYLNGDSVGANWVKHYIEYVAKVRTANFITRMNVFRNNQTYQGILLLLQDIVDAFVTMGRLADFQLTAPSFSELPKTGDTIIVNNAWKATYVDNVRSVDVYGTLYITQPSR